MTLQLKRYYPVTLTAAFLALTGCGDGNSGQSQQETISDKGIGPVTSVQLSASIDESMAQKGEELFSLKCAACHKMDERMVGPAMRGVTKRRNPEWIMNMIINPMEMVQKDPVAKQLLAEYVSPMTDMDIPEEEARAILEYFRKADQQ